MKNRFGVSIALIFLIIVNVSCKKNDNSVPDASSSLNANVQQGKWKITLYNENGRYRTVGLISVN